MKKIKNYLLAFIIPFIICLSVFYFKGVLDNIEHIYVTDLRVQHIVFLNYLKNVGLGDSSLFYSFYAGMGNSMLSTMIFYCISPINLLIWMINDIRYAILFIYIIKVCLSSLTMYILLRNKYDNDSFKTVLFSVCYALSSFAINYFFCGFWLDSLYLAPLVILGIEKMFKTEKINLIYIFSLMLAIICNIQMGFGLCVFSLIYFLYSYFLRFEKKDKKKFRQLGLVFILSSLCAGAISSGFLLGFGLDYMEMATARGMSITSKTGATNIGYILKNLFTVGNLTDTYYNNFEPFIYCGLLISFFSILYLFSKEIEKKKRTGALIIIIIFVLSFSIEFLNNFWHLSVPILLNYRYSCYLCLFLTMIAFECYNVKNKLNGSDIVCLSISLLIGLFMLVCYSNEVYFSWSLVFLILTFILILLVKNKNNKFQFLLFLLVFVEVFANAYLSIYTAEQLTFGKDVSYDSLLYLDSLNDFEDGYRVMNNYSYTEFANDSLLSGKNSSLRYFSSVINGRVPMFFDKNLSSVGNNNYKISAYDSPLMLSLMGNKYFYLTKELTNSIYNKINSYEITAYNYEQKRDVTKNVYLYENPYALSMGYVIDRDAKYDKNMSLADYQNNIIRSFSGNDVDVIIPLEYSIDNEGADCTKSESLNCTIYNITNNTKNLNIYVYGLFDKYTIDTVTTPYLDIYRPLLVSTSNRNIHLMLEGNYNVDPMHLIVVTYDKDNLISSLKKLQENMMEDIQIDKNVLTGKINSSKDGVLFLSIPYDEHLKIYVDNQEVEYYSLLDNAFIGLDIKTGEHSIKVEYIDERYKIYIVCTVVSLVVTIILYYFINRVIEKRQVEERKIEEERRNKKKKKK